MAHTSVPRPFVEELENPAVAGRCEKEPTPTQRSAAHSAENTTTMPAPAVILLLLLLTPSSLLFIPARMLRVLVSAPAPDRGSSSGRDIEQKLKIPVRVPPPLQLLLVRSSRCAFRGPGVSRAP